ncbi:hypothetical protein [Lysinibacillus sp. NPDC096212]|uniref:hypothetical protein n=1 Tax=Lysinibacillus sp. NPDC096212 TaxID=3364135 RepID=UPI0038034255
MNIQDIMAKAISAVEFMYDKKAEIKRNEKIVKPNGANGMGWVPKHLDVPCRLSTTKLDNTVQGGANVINYDVKMFLSSNFDVLAGDIVIVDGVEYESAKEPFVYVSHQEVLLIRKGYA